MPTGAICIEYYGFESTFGKVEKPKKKKYFITPPTAKTEIVILKERDAILIE